MPEGGYEFSAQENAVIIRTSKVCGAWGIISIILGALGTLGSLLFFKELLTGMPLWTEVLVPGVVYVILGIVFVMTAQSLRAVVETKGDDIANMIAAMKKLGAAFTIQIVGFVILFVAEFVAGMIEALPA